MDNFCSEMVKLKMKQNPPAYKKLSRKFFTLFTRRTLWKGPDHLLWVDRAMMHEIYKRFYYKDIQAMVVIKNNNMQIFNLAWGGLALVLGIIAFSGPGVPYFSGSFALLSMLLLAINLMMGHCCEVRLKTAVQEEKLTCLTRVKKAEKVLLLIKNLVEKEQGVLNTLELQGIGVNSVKTAPAGGSRSQSDLRHQIPGAIIANSPNPVSPGLHLWLYGILFFLGLGQSIQPLLKSPPLAVFNILSIAAVIGLGITALVRESRVKALFTVNWMVLVLALVQSFVAYISFIGVFVKNPMAAYNPSLMIKEFFAFQAGDLPIITALNIGFGAAGLILALVGALLLLKKIRPKKTGLPILP